MKRTPHPPARLPRLLALALFGVVALVGTSLVVSCGARSPLGQAGEESKRDAATDGLEDGTDDGQKDLPWVPVDGPRVDRQNPPDFQRDKFVWPDGPPKDDTWPKGDIYPGGGGNPFGCHRDADCFHLRCCPTPWGVKFCMEHCQ